MEEGKKEFIDIMKRIRIGSIIKYRETFDIDDNMNMSKVRKIESCSGAHEGCRYCVGKIIVENGYVGCLKQANSWKSLVVEIVDDFLSKKEMEFE